MMGKLLIALVLLLGKYIFSVIVKDSLHNTDILIFFFLCVTAQFRKARVYPLGSKMIHIVLTIGITIDNNPTVIKARSDHRNSTGLGSKTYNQLRCTKKPTCTQVHVVQQRNSKQQGINDNIGQSQLDLNENGFSRAQTTKDSRFASCTFEP